MGFNSGFKGLRKPEVLLSTSGECWMLYEVDWIMVLFYLL